MNLEALTPTKLSHDYEIKNFDCGDVDLNVFLLNDAKNYLNELMSITYVIEYENQIIAYFCLLNDKVVFDTLDTQEKSLWNRFNRRNQIPNSKRRKNYPAAKIGRLAVTKDFKGGGIGRFIINMIQSIILKKMDIACRFITVDAYRDAFGFYLKNGFEFLSTEDEGESVRLMYFDLKNIILS
ncbi:MAG: GNAT family N-acetyltransferase [Candidatus Symbiothrix sp.]|jgi:predicted GNAT family N-acyltransferase|nr:GNAT family N-acetyltransferase [Candidatus Symbiothrix sp.]